MNANPLLKELKVYKKRRHRRKWLVSKEIRKLLTQETSSLVVYSKPNPIRALRYIPISLKVFFLKNLIKNSIAQKCVVVPKVFSFKENYDETMLFFEVLLSSFFYIDGNVVIDFSKCNSASVSAFIQMSIIYEELDLFLHKFNNGLLRKNRKWFKIIPSTNIKVLKFLSVFDIYKSPQLKELPKDDQYLLLELQRGKLRKSYKENRKGVVGNLVVEFVNDAIRPYDVEVNDEGRTFLGSMMGEVLSNAEDHSYTGSEWFVGGTAFKEMNLGDEVIELNLAIVNYGDSMYEGFEKTRMKNSENYQKVLNGYAYHNKRMDGRKCLFGKEGLYTMLMLNEGISRLKYEKDSRGNGTMDFLNAFISLGQYGRVNDKFMSQLNIISGHTVLTCDDDVKPYKSGSLRIVSLNKVQDQLELPDDEYLRDYSHYFPGTILECKIYLNKKNLNRI